MRIDLILVRTELSGPLAINSGICPVIGPVNFTRFPKREYRLDCESHTRFAYPNGLVLGIVRYPWRWVEFSIDTMASPSSDNIAVPGPGMLLDDFAEIPYGSTRLHDFDRLI